MSQTNEISFTAVFLTEDTDEALNIIKSLQESDHQHTQRLNNHAERIRTIEFDHC